MIKYFYFEHHFVDDGFYNEKILDEKPETSIFGYETIHNGKHNEYYIDVEKYINFHGSLDNDFQEIYDRLLIQERNNKLETL